MSKRKVKVEYESPACCNPYMYGMGGYGGFQGGSNYGGMGYIRWIYALLILIVIVLQFGRREVPFVPRTINQCGNEVAATKDGNDEIAIAAIGGGYGGLGFGGYPYNFESIDRSVLFIIVVFLLILCGGCFWGGYGGCAGGYGGGGYGAY